MTTYAPVGSGSAITCLPAAAAGVTITAGAAGVAGSYAQIDDGTGVPSDTFTIVGIAFDTPSAAMVGTVEIANGAAASEVVVAAAHYEVATDAAVIAPIILPPSGPIDGGTRLAVRLTTVGGGETIKASLMMREV